MVQLENPWILLALAAIVPFLLFWHRLSYADLRPGRARLALLVRTLGLALVTFALSKPVLLLENSDRTILFLIDVSDSVRTTALEDAWEAVERHSADLEGGERAGLVLFARRPVLARAPSGAPLTLDDALTWKLFHQREEEAAVARIQALERSELAPEERSELDGLREKVDGIAAWRLEVGSDETDLEAACRLARGLLPLESRRRVVLFSDGNTNRGELFREVSELARAGVSAHTVTLQRGEEPEVVAESLIVPAEARVQAPFPVELSLQSNQEARAEVKIFRNKFLVATEELDLTVGKNRLELPNVKLEEGFHEFEAQVRVLDAKNDTVLENNVARGVVRVAGRPKVLLVERTVSEARHLEEALAGEEIDVEVRPESGLPESLNDLLNYDVVILSDVPASAFPPGAMEAVKTYVREMGGGLIMLGGEHSFGLGGYYRTPVEDALPVKMPIKKNVEKPNLALVLVIDKSGSMGGDKIELAKEAAIASAEVLKSNDRFGVVAFDGRAEWITQMTDSSEVDAITGTIARLVAGGGTNIYPALYEAYQVLLDEDAKLKHIILLSDGQTTGSDYDVLVGHIAADGITVSTVGIGEGADEELLSDIAAWGGGEAYFTSDFGSIPQIFTRETMRASKSMLIEEPFVPVQAAGSPALKGIDVEELPFLLGYIATQGKELATVSLVSDYGDPVLATWTYGLGRSAAFTSDAKARWAGDWISWEGFAKFWAQLVRSVMSTGAHKELLPRTRVTIEDGEAHLTVDVRDRNGMFRDDVIPEVSLLGAEAEPTSIKVTHLAPGLYRASFPIEEYGDFYRVLVVHKQDGEIVDVRALGVTESYSPEFRTTSPNTDVLTSIAEETGGALNPADELVWRFEGDPARTPQDTYWWWLVAALLLLPVDIGLRRLGG